MVGLANRGHSSLKDLRTFKTVFFCLYKAWALSMSVYATNNQTPGTSNFFSSFAHVIVSLLATCSRHSLHLISLNRDMERNLRLLMFCYIPT